MSKEKNKKGKASHNTRSSKNNKDRKAHWKKG